MQTAIAATLLLTLGVGSLIGWKLWTQNVHPAVSSSTITPPAAPAPGGPLSAGIYYVFLRDGSLWSTPADGSSKAERLTPKSVTVADSWVVSPPLPGRSAGDKLAYIDLQHAFVHTLRSDGQSDTVVPQPLLKAGVAPSSLWDTSTGEAILDSLAWSKDGGMLAFVADPTGANTTNLYILSMDTGSVQLVPLPIKGSVSQPVWSPNGKRIAFAVSHNGVVSILDYNTQNHGLLNITNNVNVQGRANDTLLHVQWSPDGTYVDYLDSISSGVGTLHIVNVNTATDMLVAIGVANEPTPAWSADDQQLVYSTGQQSVIVDVQGSLTLHPLKIHGFASFFSWSVSSQHQLVIALNDEQTGVYLVDTQRNSALQLDQQALDSPIFWTEIP